MDFSHKEKTVDQAKPELPAYISSTQAIMSFAEKYAHILSKHEENKEELADLIFAVEALRYEAARVIINSLIESNHVRVPSDTEWTSHDEKPDLVPVS